MCMNKKIVTVTLNPCVDLTLTVDKFLYGGTNNVIGTRKDISGKGINTSVVLKNLGTVRASNYIYLNPLFTLVGSAILLDEHLTVIALIGAACIMGGVYMAGKK